MSPPSKSVFLTPRSKTRRTLNPGQSPHDSFRFAPDVGRWRTHLVRLVRLAKQGREELQAYLDTEADAVLADVTEAGAAVSPERLRWGCALSILDDLLAAGGSFYAVDSELYVSWPDWTAP